MIVGTVGQVHADGLDPAVLIMAERGILLVRRGLGPTLAPGVHRAVFDRGCAVLMFESGLHWGGAGILGQGNRLIVYFLF